VWAVGLDQSVALAVGDMNADGLIDVVLANGSAVLLSTNTGRGDFITAPSVRVSDQGASTMLLRDRDADGTTDVVLLSVDRLSLSVCFQSGSTFRCRVLLLSLRPLAGLAAIDVDSDGRVDLLTCVIASSGSCVWLQSKGSTLFVPHTISGAPPSIVAVTTAALRSVSSADLTLLSPTGVYTMVHTGIGSFDAATAVYAAIGLTALAAADLDQDGHTDLIIASADGSMGWLQNYGTFVPRRMGSG
jgi:hypothetical protein